MLAALFLANVFIWYSAAAQQDSGVLTVAFLDVGQGDSIYIEAPNGNQVLIDGGPNKTVLRELSEVMDFNDRSIDVVIATHPDKDHIGGLVDVLSRYEVDMILRSGNVADTGVYRSLNTVVLERGVEELLARRGMRVNLGGGVHLDVLFPDRDVARVEANNASVITRLVYGETEFLFTGDASQGIENYLVTVEREQLRSDVLKIGHHGSKTSTSNFFLSAVLPSIGVVSAGEDNSYGHPHAEVLNTLAGAGIEVVGTHEGGSIVFESDGKTLRRR